jgi:hypothetical protein
MRSRPFVAALVVVFLPVMSYAQERAAAPPPELASTWSRFSSAWSRNQLPELMELLEHDCEVRGAGGVLNGSASVAEFWPAIYHRSGYPQVPTSFLVEEGRILETGRTFTMALETTIEDPWESKRNPATAVERERSSVYSRLWIRQPDGDWKVKAVVVD